MPVEAVAVRADEYTDRKTHDDFQPGDLTLLKISNLYDVTSTTKCQLFLYGKHDNEIAVEEFTLDDNMNKILEIVYMGEDETENTGC